MFDRAASRSRFVLLFARLAACLALLGCGRSSLTDDLAPMDAGLDARPDGSDGGRCDVTTCPHGCCDANGACLSGDATGTCGNFGGRCSDCTALGFDTCDPTMHVCARRPQTCDATTCPDGCCDHGACLGGFDANECGSGGQQCQHCAQGGAVCDPASRFCAAPGCGPGTCAGCCLGDLCQAGTDGTACGQAGAQCQNCLGSGQSCVAANPGGKCAQAACGPQNCAGCCDHDTCNTGDAQTACGAGGQQCTSCAALGETCQPFGGPSGGGFCASVPKCGPSNCLGCCQGDTCVAPGDMPQACGLGGGACAVCGAGQQCIGGTCQTAPCGPGTCDGCCVGDTCVPGNTTAACGAGGLSCQGCATGEACVAGVCQTQNACNAQNCPGCCVNGVCAIGTQTNACGTGGATCQNCGAIGQACQAGACVPQPCGPGTCAGCCSNGACVAGTADAQCGAAGAQCSDCTAGGNVCRAQTCQAPPPPCGPSNCLGCCDAQGICEAGFLNASCGSAGQACVSCTAQGSTCDVSVVPRTCRNLQQTCPAPYASCPSNVTTPAPTVQHVCSANDLQQARAACGSATSASCQSFFQFEQAANPACASCLQPFDVSFNDLTGILTCAAPYLDPSCNHAGACLVDCEDTSCAQCTSGTQTSCVNQVRNGQCSTYVQGLSCAFPALSGAAAFCSPQSYPNFAGWLQGVGGHYCGP